MAALPTNDDEDQADEDRGEQDHAGLAARINDRKLSLVGGAVAAIMGFLTMSVVGNATSFEARRLLDAVIPTVRYSASAYIAGGGTILALMLTMITFSISHDLSFRPGYYSRISDIATLATTVIVGSVIVLMFLAFPLGEAGVARSWYLWVFYAVLLGSSIIGGLMVSTVLLLFYAIRGLITIGQNPSESHLVDVEDVE